MTSPAVGVTRVEFDAAHQAGLNAGPGDGCPYEGGILAATWRSGWRKARERKAAERAAARGAMPDLDSAGGM